MGCVVVVVAQSMHEVPKQAGVVSAHGPSNLRHGSRRQAILSICLKPASAHVLSTHALNRLFRTSSLGQPRRTAATLRLDEALRGR